ncbi:MAG TPA: hypothetical protein ENJ09_09930 [Planctomycetes bacterium]|nr:hypothetical protein [Planctomycetota bacterium]
MDTRLGTCSSCGAEFKVPASFTHDAARCRACGDGVVRFPPISGAAGTAKVPAKKVVPRDEAPSNGLVELPIDPEEAARKRAERRTLERLKAERAAQAAAGGAPAPRTTTPKPAVSKPAVSKKAPAARPTRSSARTGTARKKAGGASRSRSRSGGASKRSSSRRGGRAGADEKKKSPLMAILLVLVLLGGAAGLYFSGILGGGDDSEVSANEPSTDTASTETAAADTEDTAQASEDAGGVDAPVSVEEGNAMIGDASSPDTADAPEAEPEPEPEPKKAAPPAPTKLSDIQDFGPAPGTTDEEWQQINEWLATFTDLDSGAAGPRAGKKLVEIGRKAFPAILNAMKTFDYSSEEGYQKGNMCQKTLQSILNGNNFGWKTGTEPEAAAFNEKVVVLYAKTWEQALTDINAFIRAAKLDKVDPDEAARLRSLYGEGGGNAPAASSDPIEDDLDVD